MSFPAFLPAFANKVDVFEEKGARDAKGPIGARARYRHDPCAPCNPCADEEMDLRSIEGARGRSNEWLEGEEAEYRKAVAGSKLDARSGARSVALIPNAGYEERPGTKTQRRGPSAEMQGIELLTPGHGGLREYGDEEQRNGRARENPAVHHLPL